MSFVHHHVVICCAGLASEGNCRGLCPFPNSWRSLSSQLPLQKGWFGMQIVQIGPGVCVWLLSEWHYFCISIFIFTFPSVLRCSIAIVPSEAPLRSPEKTLSSPEINQLRTMCPVKLSLLDHGRAQMSLVFAKEILALRTKCIFTFEAQAALSDSVNQKHTSAHILEWLFAVSYSMNVQKITLRVMLTVQIEKYNCLFARAGLVDDGRC